MALLKEDGSLDIERINALPLEEYMEEMGTLTQEQVNDYFSKIPLNESISNPHSVAVDYTLEERLAKGDAMFEEVINNLGRKQEKRCHGNSGRIEGNIPDVSDLISNVSYANDAFVQDNISEMNEGLIMTHDINSVKNIICRKFNLRPQQFCITSRNFDNTIVYLGVIILEKGASQNVIGEIKHYMQTFGYFKCVKPKYVEEKLF